MAEIIRREAERGDAADRLSVAAMCRLLGVTRAQVYRRRDEA